MFGFKKLLAFSGSYLCKKEVGLGLSNTSTVAERFIPRLGMVDRPSINRYARSFARYGRVKSRTVVMEYLTYDVVIDETKGTNPIIIMHGLLGSKNNWGSMARALNKKIGRMIYTVDARNHGESPHTAEFSYEVMVSDLLAFLQTHGILECSLIGHSLGGRVAMMLSLMYPQLVQSLVVVDISPFGASPNLLSITQLLKDIKSLELHPYLTLREARKQAASQLSQKIKDEKLIAFILTNLVENEYNTNWRWKFNLDSILKNFERKIVNFPVPMGPFEGRTLFLGGGDSDYIRPEDEPRIRALFPAAEFTYIPGAGHWVHADKPAEFLAIVSEFMNKDEPS